MKINKKILIIILIILILMLISVVSLVIFNSINKKNEPNNNVVISIPERIKQLVDNSYKYYLLKEGKVKLGEAFIEKDGIKYYVIMEDWVTSLSSIEDLIEDTFSENFTVELYNGIFKKHKFLEMNNNVYVSLSDDNCEVDYEIDSNEIEYIEQDNVLLLKINDIPVHAYFNEGKWRLNSPLYSCDTPKEDSN